MEIITCEKKCCLIKLKKYYHNSNYYSDSRIKRKAGVFFFDPKTQKVLLVQSRGHLWGLPKGTLEPCDYNNYILCAIREVKEETGLNVKPTDFSRIIKIKNRIIYYYVERDECEVNIQEKNDNDANGIGWINLDCLEEFISSGKININEGCRIAMKRFLNRDYDKSSFKLIARKLKI